ncbi:MAG: PA2169 family four-helix-bundle protein [Nitrospiria bacterium]
MAMTNDHIISTLNNLIETCTDGENGFRTAAESLTNPELMRLCRQYEPQRRRFADELQAEVRRLGGDPERGGSLAGVLHRGWINIKSAVTGGKEDGILQEAQRGEEAALKNYDEALQAGLPPDLRSIIERQRREIHTAYERLREFLPEGAQSGERSSSPGTRSESTEPRERIARDAFARRGSLPSLLKSPQEFFAAGPLDVMRRMTREMDRFFQDLGGSHGEQALWSPPIEVMEREGKFIVCAELPGLAHGEIQVEVTDRELLIQGERKRDERTSEEGAYRSERRYGRFSRVIALPDGAQADHARARFTNGVLTISIPIPQPARRSRRIAVETDGPAETAGERAQPGGWIEAA